MSDEKRLLCARCNLQLAPGASHQTAEDCVTALRHALDNALVCTTCEGELACMNCFLKEKAKGYAFTGGMALLNKLMQEPRRKKKET